MRAEVYLKLMAFEFDGGTDHYIALGSASALNLTSAFSLSFWMFTDTVSGVHQAIGASIENTNNGWRAGINGAEMLFTTKGVKDYQTTGTAVTASVWMHFCAVIQADFDCFFYVNGVFEEEITHTGAGNANSDDVWHIGIDESGVPAFQQNWNGKIEDMRVFNAVLTAEQVAQLGAGFRGPIGNEVGWWSGDDFEAVAHPDGTTLSVNTNYLHDKSTNDNRGNPTGGSIVARASDAPRYGVLV